MKDKQSKKVVIINDISSDTIEQAIFILRNSGEVASVGRKSYVLAEAQNIIQNYIQTTDKKGITAKNRPTKGATAVLKRGIMVAGVLVVGLGMCYGILNAFGFILQNL